MNRPLPLRFAVGWCRGPPQWGGGGGSGAGGGVFASLSLCRCFRRALLTRAWFQQTVSPGGGVGGERLQELGGGAEAQVLLVRLGRLGGDGGGGAPAAGLAAQLVVAGDGAVPGQHLHLAEDGLISVARLIWMENNKKIGEGISNTLLPSHRGP